ncbi:MAG: ATP-binding protein [Chloroflexota bacterium]
MVTRTSGLTSTFKGREQELAVLDRLWAQESATLFVLYGRRRVGKTRLLTHWRKHHSENALYWVAEPGAPADQLKSFSRALFRFENPGSSVPAGITYSDWETAFWHVGRIASRQQFALFIDEFTYLLDADSTIVGTLQKAWDQELKETNLMMGLSGSHMGMMEKQVLSYQAPLYGRATELVSLPPLPFGVTKEFFPNYTAEERVAIYSIFGGIPAYWERFSPSAPLDENILYQLLSNNYLLDEPLILLLDHIDNPAYYVAILQAISGGNRTNITIQRQTGLAKGHVSRYLSLLRDTGFVDRQTPVTEPESSRKSRYFVNDPFLRFYYWYLSANRTQLAIGGQDQALEEILEALPKFIEENTWPELCRDWLQRVAIHDELPTKIRFEEIGSAWTGYQDIPVVAINHRTKELVLGMALWNDSPAGLVDLQGITNKTSAIIPKDTSEWRVYFTCFSKSGWDDESLTFIDRVDEGKVGTKHWQAQWCRLISLDDVDADLTRLSKVVR